MKAVAGSRSGPGAHRRHVPALTKWPVASGASAVGHDYCCAPRDGHDPLWRCLAARRDQERSVQSEAATALACRSGCPEVGRGTFCVRYRQVLKATSRGDVQGVEILVGRLHPGSLHPDLDSEIPASPLRYTSAAEPLKYSSAAEAPSSGRLVMDSSSVSTNGQPSSPSAANMCNASQPLSQIHVYKRGLAVFSCSSIVGRPCSLVASASNNAAFMPGLGCLSSCPFLFHLATPISWRS